jgi:hypothetical protein
MKPVSLDTPLTCLNDYLLGFLSLQPNIGKREIKDSVLKKKSKSGRTNLSRVS